MGSDQQFDAIFRELRREYLAEADERLAELRADAERFASGDPAAAASLKTRFHRLAGSGGSYGFPEIGKLAREAELWIAGRPDPDAAALERLGDVIQSLQAAFTQARAALAKQ